MAKDPRVTNIEDLPGPKSKGEMEEWKMPYEEYCKKIFDVGNEHIKPKALNGVRWLSCTMYIFTPHSVANLAELGAECIKIEMPRMGDAMRHTSPFNECYLYPLHDTRPMTGFKCLHCQHMWELCFSGMRTVSRNSSGVNISAMQLSFL